MSRVNTRNAFAAIAESDSESDGSESPVMAESVCSERSNQPGENNVAWADMDTSEEEGTWEPKESKKKRDVPAAVEVPDTWIETVEDISFQHVKRKGARTQEPPKPQSKQPKLNPPVETVAPMKVAATTEKKAVPFKKGASAFASLVSSSSESEDEPIQIAPKAKTSAKKKEAPCLEKKVEAKKKPEAKEPAPAPIPEAITTTTTTTTTTTKPKKKKAPQDEKEDFNKILSEFREADGLKKKKKKKSVTEKPEEAPATAKPAPAETPAVPKATPKRVAKPTESKAESKPLPEKISELFDGNTAQVNSDETASKKKKKKK